MKTETNFLADFKLTLIEKLNDYSGGTYYGCDLAYTLFEGENANGSVLCNTYQTKAHVILLLESAQSILSKCKLVDEFWNEQIELNDENIKKLTEQINQFEGEIF